MCRALTATVGSLQSFGACALIDRHLYHLVSLSLARGGAGAAMRCRDPAPPATRTHPVLVPRLSPCDVRPTQTAAPSTAALPPTQVSARSTRCPQAKTVKWSRSSSIPSMFATFFL